jgi:hypothetical protein
MTSRALEPASESFNCHHLEGNCSMTRGKGSDQNEINVHWHRGGTTIANVG